MFQLMFVAYHPTIGYLQGESGFISSLPSNQVAIDSLQVFSRLNRPTSLCLSSYIMFSSPLTILMPSHWTHSSMSMSFLYWRAQYWTLYPWEVSQVPNRGNDPSLDLLATLIQPRLKLAFFYPRVHWWFTWICLPGPLDLFLQHCFSDRWPQPVQVARGHSIPDRGICMCFWFTPQSSFQPISLACSGWWAALPSSVLTSPPNFVLSANLLRMHSVPSSKSLMKTLDSTDPWQIPVVADCQVDFT